MKNIDNFNCVKMKREGAAIVQKKLNKLTKKEELGYWKRKYDDLVQIQYELRENQIEYKTK